MTEFRRIRVRFSDEHADLEVLLDDGAGIEALADVLGSASAELIVDGRRVPGWFSLDDAGVVSGTTIDLDENSRREDTDEAVAVIDQIAGMPGDGSGSVGVGRQRIGTGEWGSVEVDVSGDGSITVRPGPAPAVINNLRITTPTRLSAHVLNLGSSRFISGEKAVGRPFDGPLTARQRPRRPPVSILRSVAPPTLPMLGAARSSTAWLMLLPVCIALGVLGVLAQREFLAASAAVLAAAFGVLLVGRSARAREVRQHRDETHRLVAVFGHSVKQARQSVEAELRAANPSIPELARAARCEVPGYWNRCVGDHDFGRVAVAYGELDWKIRVDSEFELPGSLQQIVDANNKLTTVPIVIDLTRGTVGIVGERQRALACARALVVTLASQSSPADLRVAIAADDTQLVDWDWLKWLPQLDTAAAVACSPNSADRLVSFWRSRSHEWLQVMIVDQPKWTMPESSLLGSKPRDPGKEALIVLADSVDQLGDCASIIDLDAAGTASVFVGDNPPIRFVTPVCASVPVADDIARHSAMMHGEEAQTNQSSDRPVGVRPFQLEAGDSENMEVDLRLVPPPIPPSARKPPKLNLGMDLGPGARWNRRTSRGGYR